MQTVNEALRDAAIDHQVDLAQYSNHEARRILSLLNKANTSLTAKLTDVVDRLGAESFTAQVIDAKLKSISELLATQYKAMGEALTEDLGDVVETELGFQYSLYSSSIPAVALAAVPLVMVTSGQVRAIAFSRPFQGRLLKEWMAGLEATTASRIRDAIRMGMVEGQTTPEIIRRIMGTKAERYTDGLMEISRRDAEAVVRTAISHVNGVARDAFFSANDEILAAVVWSSTLDGRTSSGCRLRDGLRYTATDHKPVGHTIPWLAGPGRLHWRCRSGSYAITKLWSELGIEPDLGTRASMDGQVPADTTYGDWLKKQSPERQDQVLGPARGALFRSGNLSLPDFYDSKGTYLTLEQMRSKNAAAFEKAGLDNPIKPPRGMPQDLIAKFLGDKQAQEALLMAFYQKQGRRYSEHLETVAAVKKDEGYSSTPEALAAVRWYTSNGYSKLNARTRSGLGTLQDRQFQALAASGLPGMKIIDTEILRAPTKRMARADELWGRAVIGEELDVGDQFQSYSINPFVAADWADNADVLYRIERPATGAYIRPVSLIPKEDEHLIPAGLKYRVTGKSFRDIGGKRFRIIDLEIVEDE